jgi:hypothetical protein
MAPDHLEEAPEVAGKWGGVFFRHHSLDPVAPL